MRVIKQTALLGSDLAAYRVQSPEPYYNTCNPCGQCKQQALTHNLTDDGRWLCSQCTTNANLLCTFLDCDHHDVDDAYQTGQQRAQADDPYQQVNTI